MRKFLKISLVTVLSSIPAIITAQVVVTNPSFASFVQPMAGDLLPALIDGLDIGGLTSLYRNIYVSRSIQGSKSKSLTDAGAAVSFMTVAVPTNGWANGELQWAATSVSGADQLVASGSRRYWGVTTGTTPVCGIGTIGTDGEGHSGGANTLVCTWTNVVSGQTCALSVTCTNNLAGTQAITVYGRTDMMIPNTLNFP